ncbi:MAG: hypothetical protein AVDCRST_MAG51-1207, partial [uncultured Ramlibacter sp.]
GRESHLRHHRAALCRLADRGGDDGPLRLEQRAVGPAAGADAPDRSGGPPGRGRHHHQRVPRRCGRPAARPRGEGRRAARGRRNARARRGTARPPPGRPAAVL